MNKVRKFRRALAALLVEALLEHKEDREIVAAVITDQPIEKRDDNEEVEA